MRTEIEGQMTMDGFYDESWTLTIPIKYHADIEPLACHGDWIDLRAAEDVELKAGEFKLISLGVSMKLPSGYEAHIVPRSSTFKNWGILQTNHMGVIDNAYCGNDDIWMFPALATRDTFIEKNSRICQFRLVGKMEKFAFVPVDRLESVNRGGFGTSGRV
jgi:dUTP pyrophosphatase